MGLQKYIEVAKIEVSERMSHFWNQLAWSVLICVVIVVFLQLWRTIYGDNVTIAGFTFSQMIWYTAFAEVLVMGLHSMRIEKIGELVRSGDIAMQLSKPISFLGREFALGAGIFLQKVLVTGTIATIFTWILVGPPPVTLTTLVTIPPIVLGAYIIQFALTRTVGLFAFWFEEIRGFYYMYSRIVFIFGGMLVPIDVYPRWIQQALLLLPFSHIIYYPSRLFVEHSATQFTQALIGQIIWAIILVGVCFYTFYKGSKKVNIHGG